MQKNKAYQASLAYLMVVFTGVIGLAVMLSWKTGSLRLVQIFSDFAPMQFNTALCFFLSSCAAIFLIRKSKITFIFSGLVVAIAGASLTEHLLEINFGIDTLFSQSDISTKVVHLGRMSSITSYAFLVFAWGCILGVYNKAFLAIFNFSIVLICLAAIISYLLGLNDVRSAGLFSGMAIHTTLGFALLSIGTNLYLMQHNRFRPKGFWELAPIFLSLIIVVLTFASWKAVTEVNNQRNQDHFQSLIVETTDLIKERFLKYEQSLMGGLGMYYASESVERDQWLKFSQAFNIEKKLPGINGIGYIDYVPESELDEYLQEVRLDGAPNFKNHPDTPYNDKFIIKYTEPAHKNKEALGLDIGFEAHRRKTAERSRDMGRSELTHKIKLVQDNQSRAGFLLMVPVYKTKSTPETLIERRENIQGWVYAPFIGQKFLEKISPSKNRRLYFEVYNGPEFTAEYLIYKDQSFPYHLLDKYEHVSKIVLAERAWDIRWRAGENIAFPGSLKFAEIILFLGLSIAIFSYIAVFYAIEGRYTAVEASKTKSTFLANMSHELRTPLNSIIGMVQLLETKLTKPDNIEMFNIMKQSSQSLLEIVNDILDISKIEAKEMTLEQTAFDLSTSISHAVNLMQPIAQEKGLRLELIGNEDAVVTGDSLRFQRILINLIGNAVRYTEKGEIKVVVEITQLPENNKTQLHCKITDTGVGIPENQRDKVFDKFVQVDDSSTRAYGGAGLGLTITNELLELMGGKIDFVSQVGKGTTFWFDITFPVAKKQDLEKVASSAETSRETKVYSSVKSTGEIKILIAEDHAMNQVFMKKVFSSLGIENYKISENGNEAIEALKSDEYDLILMDCHMPVMNGYETTQEIRGLSDDRLKNIPIIAMTANALPEDEARCLEIGMDAYIAKPIDLAVFKEKLAKWVSFETDEVYKEQKKDKEESLGPVDLKNLRENSMGDKDFIMEMIEMFVSQGSEQIASLKEQCTDGENNEWVEISHALKGTAGGVGAVYMHRICAKAQKMEDATSKDRKKILSEIKNLYEEAKSYFIENDLVLSSSTRL